MPAHLSSINWILTESSVDDSGSGFGVIPVYHCKVWIVSGEGRGVKYELPSERVHILLDERRGVGRHNELGHNVPPEQEAKRPEQEAKRPEQEAKRPEQEAKRMSRSAAVTSGRESVGRGRSNEVDRRGRSRSRRWECPAFDR